MFLTRVLCSGCLERSSEEDSNPVTNLWLRIIYVITFTAHIASNIAAAMGLFGSTVTTVSAKHPTLLTPAGWTFSIWGLIFCLQVRGTAHCCALKYCCPIFHHMPWLIFHAKFVILSFPPYCRSKPTAVSCFTSGSGAMCACRAGVC